MEESVTTSAGAVTTIFTISLSGPEGLLAMLALLASETLGSEILCWPWGLAFLHELVEELTCLCLDFGWSQWNWASILLWLSFGRTHFLKVVIPM